MDHSTALPVPGSEPLPFRPAAAGNEWLLADAFKGADVDETELFPIAFGIKLGCGQAAGNLLSTLHGIGVECPFKSCRPAWVYVCMNLTDIPDVMAELHGEITENAGILKFADTR